jgi:uncharacterized protein (TIGR00251 family)
MNPGHFRSHEGKKSATLVVRVKPRARQNRILEVLSDGTIKIHIKAPPVEGKANEALIKFLAEILDVPISHLELISGNGRRDKLVSVIGMDAVVLQKKIVEQIR